MNRDQRTGWMMCLLLLGGCQPPLIVEDGDGSSGSAPGTTDGPDDPPPMVTTTTAEPMTSGTGEPTTADDTSTGEPTFPEYCDVLEQDCPRGYKCTVYIDVPGGNIFANRCVEVADEPLLPQSPCTVDAWPPSGEDQCDATSFCFNVDPETLQGTCTAFCIGTYDDPHCAEPCEYCTLSGDGALMPCLPTCDPLGDDCPEGQGCYAVNEAFVCAPEYRPAGVGGPCEFVNVCISGTACIAAEAVPDCTGGAGCCSPYCDPAAAFDPCPKVLPGTTCQPWYQPGEEPLPECGYDPPGVCALP